MAAPGKEAAVQEYLQTARACYRQFLEAPLLAFPAARRLWIVPDGDLHFLPFDALLTGDAHQISGKSVPFLIRKYATGYAFTAHQFFLPSSPVSTSVEYTGWGIRYDSTAFQNTNRNIADPVHLNPLPKARAEVESVQHKMGGKIWLDDAATKNAFLEKAPQAGICHLAMHAIADDESPQDSRLVFWPGDSTSLLKRYLSVTEIIDIQFHTQLMVLSACNTANGSLMPGEGVSSLGRAFQFAGVRSVLMSRWDADDNVAFHRDRFFARW